MIKRIFILSLLFVGTLAFQSCLSNDILEHDLTNTNPLDSSYDGENFWTVQSISTQAYPWVNKVEVYIRVGVDWDMFEHISSENDLDYGFYWIKMDIVDTDNNIVKRGETLNSTITFDFDEDVWANFDMSEHHYHVQGIYPDGRVGKVYDVYP